MSHPASLRLAAIPDLTEVFLARLIEGEPAPGALHHEQVLQVGASSGRHSRILGIRGSASWPITCRANAGM